MIIKIAATSLAAMAASLGLVTLTPSHASSVAVSGDIQVYCGQDALCPNGMYVGQ